MKIVTIALFILLTITGCSNKKYFEPEKITENKNNPQNIPSKIVAFNRTGATLKNGQVVTEYNISDYTLPFGYEFINNSKKGIIATDNKSQIIIGNKSNSIEVGGIVVAATLKHPILAMIYSNNSYALYNIEKKKYLLKEYLTPSLINDTRITNPIFMENLVILPTLNGKLIIINLTKNRVIKTITIDSNNQFNNITYLKILNNKLVTATANKVVVISSNKVVDKEYEISDITTHGNNIYIATIDGNLIKLDINLIETGKKKYKFARFYALAFGKSLYALESQGFLVEIDNNFKSDLIYSLSIDDEDKIISIKNRFYFGKKFIEVN